jgi:hypothetical protein
MANRCTHIEPGCGCVDAPMTTPPACPPSAPCPEAQPCSSYTDAQCVIYTGVEITCNEQVIAEQNQPLSEILQNLTDLACSSPIIADAILCGEDTVVAAGTSVVDALPLIVQYFCDAIAGLPTVTLASDGSVSSESIVKDGTGPTLTTKGLVGGTDVSITDDGTDLTIAFTGAGVTQQNVFSNIYDSGWVDIPNFNGAFGIAPIVGNALLELRVVIRVVLVSKVSLLFL